MNISINKNTESFFGLSTLIPGTIWFLAGYISHIETAIIATQKWASIIAFMGLLAPQKAKNGAISGTRVPHAYDNESRIITGYFGV